LGLVIATWVNLAVGPSIVLAIVLAFIFGYALTMVPLLRAGTAVRAALGLALAADTISIVVMELVDNAFLVAVPGAMEAGLFDALFWITLVTGFAVAWVVTFPVNRWLILRGRGHAVVHGAH
jgi:uncharacterized protein DUF4396